MGRAVVRNRMKRRMREAVRLHLHELPAQWAIVFNPRKPLLDAPFRSIEAEVQKLFQRCANLS
jgi:ribonuclease P protein component